MATLVTPKKWHLIVLGAMVICLIFLFIRNRMWSETIIRVNNTDLQILVADTLAKQHEGWSNKPDMLGKDGMLFIFGYNTPHAMVMRDMQFPIDIVWVSDSGTITDMVIGAKPEPGVAEADLIVYQSRLPSAAVLELKAGLISQLGLSIGDTVVIKE